MKQKIITTTTLVEEALRAADGFLTLVDLIAITQRSRNQVDAALYHLHKRNVLWLEIQQGVSYWAPRPVCDDNRSRHVEERTPEDKPRKEHRRQPNRKKGAV